MIVCLTETPLHMRSILFGRLVGQGVGRSISDSLTETTTCVVAKPLVMIKKEFTGKKESVKSTFKVKINVCKLYLL